MAQSPQKYDLIIVGGGIYGIFLALEAGRRGLRSVLLEKDTWGAGTTGGWLRILHGGLRYLQTMDLPRFYESVRERRWYMQLFPELVRPLPCVMPLYRDHSHSPLIMRAALAANDVLSAHRNRGVPSGNHLPRGRVLSAEDVRSMLPFAETAGLRAGALWYDAMAIEPEGLLSALLGWAKSLGADSHEAMEAISVLDDGARVTGVEAVSGEDGVHSTFLASVVVNMTGHWSLAFAQSAGLDLGQSRRLSWAWNVLFDVPYNSDAAAAVAARRPGAQTFFIVPWRGRALVGTGHAPLPPGSEDAQVPEGEIHRFINEVSEAVPALGLSPAKVHSVLEGKLPVSPSDPHRLSGRPLIADHGAHGKHGLFTVWGIKYTTARAVARRVLKLAFANRLGQPGPYSRPGGGDMTALPPLN